jgi:hypothetical protein
MIKSDHRYAGIDWRSNFLATHDFSRRPASIFHFRA